MLKIDNIQTLNDVTVYGDDQSFGTFYLLSQQPRFRLDAAGDPILKFLMYKFPVDRPDGRKGGGFLFFDAELAVPDAARAEIEQTLAAQVQDEARRLGVAAPPLVIGSPTFTDGEVKVNVLNQSGDFVNQVFNPGKPSLFGNNVAAVGVELTPDGAALVDTALQGKGGVVQIAYTLFFWAKLPPMTVVGTFHSEQFYSYYQEVDIDWSFWGEDSYRETVRESLRENETTHIEVKGDPAWIERMGDWAQTALEKKVEAKMIAALAPATEDQRKVPDGIENVTRDLDNERITDVRIDYSASATAEWDLYPQGTVPNITTLKNAAGESLKWEDFSDLIDLDHQFFKQIRVDVKVNADFENLPIHSVEVKVRYKGQPMARLGEGPEGEASFSDPDTVVKFAAFVQGDDWSYSYSYQVNYEGTSQTYQSEDFLTDEGVITVGVDDVGILLVDVAVGDINWTEVQSAQVKLTYEDLEEGVGPLEEQFVLSKESTSHVFKRVIFKPFRKAYKYEVKYFMHDGREFATAGQESRAHNLFINDPFAGRQAIKVLAVGDLQTAIDNIFVDLAYVDAQNDYRQEQSAVLNATSPFFDWVFPVIDEELGVLTYSGNVVLKNGTVRAIPAATPSSSTVIVPKPPQDNLDVEFVTDLIDFTTVKLVRVSLSYADDANFASVKKDLVFSPAKPGGVTVRIPIFDLTKKTYNWKATFFMADNTRREIPPTDGTDSVVVLEAP